MDTQFLPADAVFQIEEVTVLAGVATHRIYGLDENVYTNGVLSGTYAVPKVVQTLDNTNTEGLAVDTYRLYRVYNSVQNPVALYDQAVLDGLLDPVNAVKYNGDRVTYNGEVVTYTEV